MKKTLFLFLLHGICVVVFSFIVENESDIREDEEESEPDHNIRDPGHHFYGLGERREPDHDPDTYHGYDRNHDRDHDYDENHIHDYDHDNHEHKSHYDDTEDKDQSNTQRSAQNSRASNGSWKISTVWVSQYLLVLFVARQIMLS
ncbi:protein catecholamines up-like [Limulus polyphemus]|uniref:Protein catecholamines up-like n=1 Tax=Limulus polyphemus TaxID=6850 RepID=A0ABM1SGD5_LIMPO|nr:protein catecholamines up-like [Limulus polyphemus]